MSVHRYRDVSEMPPPWRPPDDPAALRHIAAMIALYWSLQKERPARGVRKFRTIQEANEDRNDPYRRENPELIALMEGRPAPGDER